MNPRNTAHISCIVKSPTPIPPLSDVEREYILSVLRHFKGRRKLTADTLKIGLRTLGLKLRLWKKQGLIPESL